MKMCTIDPNRGRGLVATKGFATGEVLWNEDPVVRRQVYENSFNVAVCTHCLQPIGTLGGQLVYMAEGDAEDDSDDGGEEQEEENMNDNPRAKALNQELPYLSKAEETFLSEIFSCPDCGDTFCSFECYQAARKSYHRVTCGCDEDILDKFVTHALENDEVLLSVKQAVECVIAEVDERLGKHTPDSGTEPNPKQVFDECAQPFLVLCHAPWHQMPDPEQTEAARWQVVCDSALRLRKCIQIPVPQCCEVLFEPHTYARMAGALSLNNICVSFASPQQQYHASWQSKFKAGDRIPESFKTVLQEIADVQKKRQEEWGIEEPTQYPFFPEFEGTALFRRLALINHSCRPCVSYEFTGTSTLLLIATRPIAVGEELTISYCDETADVAQRKEALSHWGFTCECQLCRVGGGGGGGKHHHDHNDQQEEFKKVMQQDAEGKRGRKRERDSKC